MKKYLLVLRNSLEEFYIYRFNFILYRFRVIVSILINYYLWKAVYMHSKVIFGYQEQQMLTYIFMTIFINGIVLSTQTFRVGEEINLGRLSDFIIKPLNYFLYNIFRDLADKAVNFVFSLLEFALIIFILKPSVIFQTDLSRFMLFVISVVGASVLYFEISMFLSFVAFWSDETWSSRFLFTILIAFLAGNYFPLDIVPGNIYTLLSYLPFTYLLFFPLKIYLGQVNTEFMIHGFLIMIFWILSFNFIMRWCFKKGLKVYTAEGI